MREVMHEVMHDEDIGTRPSVGNVGTITAATAVLDHRCDFLQHAASEKRSKEKNVCHLTDLAPLVHRVHRRVQGQGDPSLRERARRILRGV